MRTVVQITHVLSCISLSLPFHCQCSFGCVLGLPLSITCVIFTCNAVCSVLVYRCFLSATGGPAQWPDASRLVEAVCIRLCQLHPSAVKSTTSHVREPRWKAILADYRSIRELVVSNLHVMERTGMQLYELNHRTLTQWFVAFCHSSDSMMML